MSESGGLEEPLHEREPNPDVTTETATREITPEGSSEPLESEQTRLDPAELAGKVATPDRRRSSVGEGAAKPDAEEDKPFDFQEFLNQMRMKSADAIARYVKSFLNEFAKRPWSAKEQAKIVRDFRIFIKGKMAQISPFAEMDDAQWNNAQEGMEKLIMNRIYGQTFPPKIPKRIRKDDQEEDIIRDRVFSEKLRLWNWIEGRHLDIDEETLELGRSFAELACRELNKINNYRAPRDKLICILNCSKVIFALIRQAKKEQNADSFLPLMIYVVIKAQPSFLISNINYITRFRAAQKRQGEAGYYLSMTASAVAFIEGLDKSNLSIDEKEYQERIEASVQQEQEKQAQRAEQGTDGDEEATLDVAVADPIMPSSVISASAGLLVEQLKSYANKIFEPDDVATPPQQGSPRPVSELTDSPEEAAARQASAEMYRAQQLQQKEFQHLAGMVQEMFPMLDREVIEDVLREKGTRVGAAIDVCSSLVGES